MSAAGLVAGGWRERENTVAFIVSRTSVGSPRPAAALLRAPRRVVRGLLRSPARVRLRSRRGVRRLLLSPLRVSNRGVLRAHRLLRRDFLLRDDLVVVERDVGDEARDDEDCARGGGAEGRVVGRRASGTECLRRKRRVSSTVTERISRRAREGGSDRGVARAPTNPSSAPKRAFTRLPRRGRVWRRRGRGVAPARRRAEDATRSRDDDDDDDEAAAHRGPADVADGVAAATRAAARGSARARSATRVAAGGARGRARAVGIYAARARVPRARVPRTLKTRTRSRSRPDRTTTG